MNSLYIHIPFCAKKCLYCDFYSIGHDEKLASKFIDILSAQAMTLKIQFDTIYIGGGTPSVLESRLLEKLLKSLKAAACNVKEFTIEANPESITAKKLKLFLNYGINRISIGVQSFDDKKLAKLGRIHSGQKAIEAVNLAKHSGFKNISIDLIFGVWQETLGAWKEELKAAMELPLKHISCYSLSYEKHAKLSALLKEKSIIPQSDEVTVKMYEHAIDYLGKNKFFHYEISNFSKAGFQCKHNLNYWQNNSYVGLGPSAVSYREGKRAKNISDGKKYIELAGKGKSTVVFNEKLSLEMQAKETAAIKIRTTEGIDFDWFKKRTGFDFLKLESDDIDFLIKQRLLKYKKSRSKESGIALTRKGFLFCDSVSAQLL
ncbi:MAG: radical SAM family heme chaperone HemW [Candidatus Omnitrophota bacterium]|jgi:oxygen-independent coproporphyrinogen-3 oxidase